MANKFKKGKCYVLSNKKFKEKEGEESFKLSKKWLDFCSGRIVNIEGNVTGNVLGFGVCSKWCTEVKQNYKYNG